MVEKAVVFFLYILGIDNIRYLKKNRGEHQEKASSAVDDVVERRERNATKLAVKE